MRKIVESIKKGTLLGKYLMGVESSEESKEIKAWIKKDPDNRNVLNSVNDKRNIKSSVEEFEKFNPTLAWQAYIDKIINLRRRKVLLRWKIAAIFFLITTLASIVSYFIEDQILFNHQQLSTTINTEAGQNSRIVLPDNTIVWLNSGTALTYNNKFSITNRDVQLEGRAYLKVKHDKQHPFVISCKNLRIKVLGTEFDVDAYTENDEVKVVLASGSVELSFVDGKLDKHTLNPGERATVSLTTNKVKVDKIDVKKSTMWKDGYMVFENDAMQHVITQLQHWYNIDIEVLDKEVFELVFNATIKDESLEELLSLIEYSCPVKTNIIYSKNQGIKNKVILKRK